MSSDERPKRDTMSLGEATVSNIWEIAAIGIMFERKSLCAKQDGYDIIAEFRRKNPLFELGPEVCRLWYSPLGWRDRIRRRSMTRHGKQYGAIVIVLVGLVALPGGGQAQQQELTGKDGAPMVLVPAGEFTMGGNEAVEEKPVHQVSLDAYYMDKYEVTVEQYAKFLDATRRGAPPEWKIMNQPSHQKHPIVMVDWVDADAYCHWAEKRLPTEAEWEKAARGTDGRIYPWGNDLPTPLRANYGKKKWDKNAALVPVGTLEDGKSPYGIYDMAGNAWEWVSDWYDKVYYKNSPSQNPKGPERGDYKALRGGSWHSRPGHLHSANRNYSPPAHHPSHNNGFRCAKTP